MAETRTVFRFFTIADFHEEEAWLREQHKNGWKLTGVTVCIYHFEKCEPEDVVYRLDFKNNKQDPEYMQLLSDYGWEYVGSCIGWLYLRKPAAGSESENDCELFSDDASRIDMLKSVMKRRLLPVGIVFFCCVLPNAFRSLDHGADIAFTIFWVVMIVLYAFLFVHCAAKLSRLKNELER